MGKAFNLMPAASTTSCSSAPDASASFACLGRLAAGVLRAPTFYTPMLRSAELLRELLAEGGYHIDDWQPLPATEEVDGRIGWLAAFSDPALAVALVLRFTAEVSNSGTIQVNVQVHAASRQEAKQGSPASQQEADFVADVCVASTGPLRNWATMPNPVQRLEAELDSRMAFAEMVGTASAPRGVLRALRAAKSFRAPESWVPDAAQVILSALSLS